MLENMMFFRPDMNVFDRVAEFQFMNPNQLQLLYDFDKDNYHSAILSFIESLMLAEKLYLPENKNIFRVKESKDLWEQFDSENRIAYSTIFNSNGLEQRQKHAYETLDKNWKKICNEIAHNERVKNGIIGHCKREFAYSKGLLGDSRDINHYNKSQEALMLPNSIRGHLFAILKKLCNDYDIKYEDSLADDLIDRNFTTHFRSMYEHRLYGEGNYTPALTRQLNLFDDLSSQVSGKQQILQSLASLIVSKVHDRSALVETALNFLKTDKGARIHEGFKNFLVKMSYTEDKKEQEKIWNDIRSVLNNLAPWHRKMIICIIPCKKDLNYWVWQLRGHDILTFNQKIYDLVHK